MKEDASVNPGAKLPRLAGFLLPLLLLAAAPYYPALKAGYLNWDDRIHTAENPLIRDFSASSLRLVFTAHRHGNYHPLTDLSLGVEALVFGESPAVHHAGNILLHALNACLVFLLVSALSGSPGAAFWAALLWAWHPLQAESVCWIAERKNLLYSFFYLAALLAYLRHAARPAASSLAAVAGLFLASLLSKASAVTLPLVLPLADIHLKRSFTRRASAEKIFFILLSAVFIAVSAVAQGKTGGGIITANPVTLLSFYIIKAIWPAGLSGLYPYTELSAHISGHLPGYILPAGFFAAAAWYAAKRERTASFGLLFFIINLLPFLVLIPVGPSLAADRYLYVPLAGLAVSAAALSARLLSKAGRRAELSLLLTAVLAGLFMFTASVRRAGIWKDSLSFWNSVSSSYPENPTVLLNLAEARISSGEPAKAEKILLRLLAKDPGNGNALYNLGTLYGIAGRFGEAEDLLKRSLRIRPDHAPAWSNLGKVQLALGRAGEAKKALLTALSADPSYAPAYANLAEAELKLGLDNEAARHMEKYRELNGRP